MVEIPNTYFIYAGAGFLSLAFFYAVFRFGSIFIEKRRELLEKTKRQDRMRIAREAKQAKKLSTKDDKEIATIDDNTFYQELKGRDYLKEIPRWRWIKRWRRSSKYNDLNRPVLARIHMDAGNVREILADESEQTIKYKKGSYILDGKSCYFNSDIKLYCYDFHEHLALPYSNKIGFNKDILKFFNTVNSLGREELKDPLKYGLDVNAEMDKIEASGVIEVETALHPTVFQRIHDNKIVQAILQGAAIPKLVKILIILAVIILLAIVLDVLIDLWDSGLIDQVVEGVK